ncbi:MAG: polysaccharide deacetylase family protein [Firmicutes bacterium]|nr:polysaccharide deacetylase family protein [Bacillota bacterium]
MSFVVVKRSWLRLLVFMLLVAVCLVFPTSEGAAASVYFGDNLRKVPIYNVATDESRVAISFDAAWGADKTQGILNILAEYNVNATFFLVGFWVRDYPEMVKAIDAAGCEIGTHSNTHPDMVKLSGEQVREELSTSVKLIEDTISKKVTLFRAPFGSYNNTLLNTASELGLKTIQWDVDSLDWKSLGVKDMTNRVTGKAKNGSVILFHNNSDHILEALPVILDLLIKKGFKVGQISDLIYKDNYTIDRAGVQRRN